MQGVCALHTGVAILRFSVFLSSLMTIRPDAWFWLLDLHGRSQALGTRPGHHKQIEAEQGAHASWANETGQESAEA